MHTDIVHFLKLIADPNVSSRRLRTFFWRLSDNDTGRNKVSNKELRIAFRSIRKYRPDVLTEQETRLLRSIVKPIAPVSRSS